MSYWMAFTLDRYVGDHPSITDVEYAKLPLPVYIYWPKTDVWACKVDGRYWFNLTRKELPPSVQTMALIHC